MEPDCHKAALQPEQGIALQKKLKPPHLYETMPRFLTVINKKSPEYNLRNRFSWFGGNNENHISNRNHFHNLFTSGRLRAASICDINASFHGYPGTNRIFNAVAYSGPDPNA